MNKYYYTKFKSKKSILKNQVRRIIAICPQHWLRLKDLSIIPDVNYAFYQTFDNKFGDKSFPYKLHRMLIRKYFHEIYLKEYKGKYILDLENTEIGIGIKKLEFYQKYLK